MPFLKISDNLGFSPNRHISVNGIHALFSYDFQNMFM